MINTIPTHSIPGGRTTSYTVITPSGKELGKFVMDIDGYFYFVEKEAGGYYSQELLFALAQKLQDLNRKYTAMLRTFTVNGIKYVEGSRGPVAVGLTEEE